MKQHIMLIESIQRVEEAKAGTIQKIIDHATKKGYDIESNPNNTKFKISKVDNSGRYDGDIEFEIYTDDDSPDVWVNWIADGGMSGNDPIDEFTHVYSEWSKGRI